MMQEPTVEQKYAETPLMKQYYEIKRKHPDAILLFRVGDFYETFGEDAIKASEILGITLTRRANGSASFVELAGVPYHAIDTYLPKLVRAGQRVAICEQLEDPKKTKNIVKRGVTELVTPGVSLNDNVLEHRENNFLASVHLEKNIAGVSFLDISTGEFFTAEGSFEYIDKLLNSFRPKEVLCERSKQQQFKELFGEKFYLYKLDDWVFTEENTTEKLLKKFQTASLKGFGVHNLQYGIIAAGAILQYLELTHHDKTQHISSLSRIEEEHYVWLDKFTIRNLELFYSINEGAKTLIDVIDRTLSPMGARMLKRWVALPLKEEKPIKERHDVVEHLIKNNDFRDLLSEHVKNIGDLERIISKVATGRVNPREVVQLKIALTAIQPIKQACLESGDAALTKIGDQLNPCFAIRDRIEKELLPDPSVLLSKGNFMANGISAELDEYRKLAYSGKDYLAQIQQREIERTGIASLKISFNNVFGYYIEVRNTHKDKVPAEWIRKQTLVSAERYITEELKEYETKILGAEEKALELENQLFLDLVASLSDYIPAIQLNASLIAKLDCLLSFAVVAEANNYFRPEINNTDIINIRDGRHPVIEKMLPIDEPYISNDILLDNDQQQIIMITGPNMSGKSALLRQTALIVLLAQIGSYVPAASAKIGLVDKIFTRVGASDNISLGESTFMVEMHEAASILNNLSHRSLILLDEIGRGTSTYDGISIAWAMAEYIHEHPTAKAKTLFATHYHELNEMEKSFVRIKNYNVSIKELDNKVIFLRKLKRGGSEHSFGIHVAQMAGMPKSVVNRANEILKDLEKSGQKDSLAKPVGEIAQHREGYQTTIFQLDDPVLKQIRDEIKKLDINNLTPVEALNKLNDIKRHIGL
ncbi:MAG: DNA mismatch repair protein MutS [Bacteroidetes bacterium GWC2_33_15]|nr:MAG: DNA mismatch repair protein MutS [Bacteroidetes bacterium GWA2_33_15]OFX50156.1 MAG: DNA mismatch repair protein MutS [Bacteroidetes bacterium GWC2_33_15]OFX65308.1 MAG: DNA mismatch repair protein MutS [Bacteroidetes bacterium GWB2_32_14]OFX70535.1 MAG: DNA mismatch repair protein MutS [Bacteroidetes bacterium GWD2_33_33]